MPSSQISDHCPLDHLLSELCTWSIVWSLQLFLQFQQILMKLSNYYSRELKRIRLYCIAFCHSSGPLSFLAILSTLCLVSSTHLTLLRDFDSLVIIIWSSNESFQSCITQILIGPHVGGRLAVSLLLY